MRLEIPAQSIEMRHLSYPLRKKIEGGGGGYTITVTQDLLDATTTDTAVGKTDLTDVYTEIRRQGDEIYNGLLQRIDCMEGELKRLQCEALRDLIFAADTAPTLTTVSPLSSTTIAWQNVRLNNSLFNYNSGSGVFTPRLEGYYRVDVYFNDQHTNSSTRQALRVTSTVGSTPADVDEYTGTTADRLAGHKIFYCNGTTDTFQVQMHNYDASITNTYNSPLQGYHSSYVTAQYVGDKFSTN